MQPQESKSYFASNCCTSTPTLFLIHLSCLLFLCFYVQLKSDMAAGFGEALQRKLVEVEGLYSQVRSRYTFIQALVRRIRGLLRQNKSWNRRTNAKTDQDPHFLILNELKPPPRSKPENRCWISFPVFWQHHWFCTNRLISWLDYCDLTHFVLTILIMSAKAVEAMFFKEVRTCRLA